jgi:6-pyruvoyltetrahydropterin/6-carboxytetrahydropterin synthase
VYELKVVTRFAAAHRLTMVGAKCENMHGHNWTIEAYVAGGQLDGAGVLMDFGLIKARLREIIGRLDHQYLNELEMFAGRQPSSERIAAYVAEELRRAITAPGVRVSRVSAWESEDACATYIVD